MAHLNCVFHRPIGGTRMPIGLVSGRCGADQEQANRRCMVMSSQRVRFLAAGSACSSLLRFVVGRLGVTISFHNL